MGFSSNPLIHENLLICLVGGEGSVAVAFDKSNGKEVWRALSAKEPGYAPPVIIKQNDEDQLIIWNPESVNALNPKTENSFGLFPGNFALD